MITLLSGLVLLCASSLAEATTHVVKSGENMFRISLRYGVTLSELQAANPGVRPQSLRVGQKLAIPSHGKDSGVTTTAKDEPVAEPQSTTPASTNSGDTYTVQAGDNLSKIARLHNTTVAALQAANPKLKPNQVVVGQTIALPQAQPKSTAPAPATIAETPAPATTKKEVAKETPAPIAKAETKPAPEPKPLATTDAPMPSATSNVSQVNQNAPANATPAYRLIKTTRELTLEQVAKEYKTTTEKINSLNGWNFSPQTLLAVDSELYIPTQP